MKKKFKLHNTDKTRVVELATKLHDNNVNVWISLNRNDISDCQWRWVDNPINAPWSPANKWRSVATSGGIGVLIRELQEACFAHGIMRRATHIASRRSHMRLSSDASGKCWTTANGG